MVKTHKTVGRPNDVHNFNSKFIKCDYPSHWIKNKIRKNNQRKIRCVHFFLTFTIHWKSVNIGLNMSFGIGAHEIGICPNRLHKWNNSHKVGKLWKKTSVSMMKRFFSSSFLSRKKIRVTSKRPTQNQWIEMNTP